MDLIGLHDERYPYSDAALWRILMATEEPTWEREHAWKRRRKRAVADFVASLMLFGVNKTSAVTRAAKVADVSQRTIWRQLS